MERSNIYKYKYYFQWVDNSNTNRLRRLKDSVFNNNVRNINYFRNSSRI